MIGVLAEGNPESLRPARRETRYSLPNSLHEAVGEIWAPPDEVPESPGSAQEALIEEPEVLDWSQGVLGMALEPEMLVLTKGVLDMALERSEAGSEVPGATQESFEVDERHFAVWQNADFIVLHVRTVDGHVVWDFREGAPGGMAAEDVATG